MNQVEQVSLPAKQVRQYRSREERRRIVEETLVSGVSVAVVARRHGINANQVFQWRTLYGAGLLNSLEEGDAGQRMLPVNVVGEAPAPIATLEQAGAAPAHGAHGSTGAIELTLARAQVRIVGHVDAASLRVVLECLLG